jgi:stringent starvation protein B
MLYKKTLKPYMLNAFYTWAIDLGLTPLIEVQKNSGNQIPPQLNPDDTVIFNIHPNATRNLVLGKEHIEFHAKFNGISEQITVLHSSISRIFNKEDNYGLDFDIEIPPEDKKIKKLKPILKIVKKDDDE